MMQINAFDEEQLIESLASPSSTTSVLMKLSSDDWREICKYSTPCDMFRISQVNREMMEKFLPFNIDQEKDSSLPFGWTVQFMQKCIATHFRKPLQFKLFTIEEEKLYEKMVNGRISNRREMFQCLKLYLKYNFLLLNKNREHDWEFIVKFKVRTLIGKDDSDREVEELKCYHVLIDQLRNNQLNDRYLDSFDRNDILVVHGYRINKGTDFKIFEISKLDLNEKSPPMIFNYENHYENINFINHYYYNQDTVYGTIIQNAMNKRFQSCDFPTALTKRQVFELPQRKVILRVKQLQDFVRSYQPYGMQFMPASVHISTTTSFNVDYSYPMKTLVSKEILKPISKDLLHALAVVAYIYMNHKVFGFSSFYHNYSQYSYLLSDVLSDSSLFVKVLGCIGMTLFNVVFGVCVAMSFANVTYFVPQWTNFHHTGMSLYWIWAISNVILFLKNIDVFQGLYPVSLTSIHVYWSSVELFHAFLLAVEFSYVLVFAGKLKFWGSHVVSKISKWFTNLKNRFWN